MERAKSPFWLKIVYLLHITVIIVAILVCIQRMFQIREREREINRRIEGIEKTLRGGISKRREWRDENERKMRLENEKASELRRQLEEE